MYFVILCYYLIFNVFKRIKWMRALIACFIGFLSLIYLLILIDSFIQNVQTCKCTPLPMQRTLLPCNELRRCLDLYHNVPRLQIQLAPGKTQNLKTQQNPHQRLIRQGYPKLNSHQNENPLQSRLQSTIQTYVAYDHLQYCLPNHRSRWKSCF